MRCAVAGVVLFGLAEAAHGADLDALRGSEVFAPSSPTYTNWSGFYVGGQGGFSHADVTFGTGARTMLNRLINPQLPGAPGPAQIVTPLFRDSADGATFGGFVGYNSQWESVILGIEANYNHASIDSLLSQTIPIAPPNIGTGTASSSTRITDYATVRGRAGFVMGQFLPYVMVGVAVGHADFTDSASLRYTPVVAGIPQPDVNLFTSGTQSSIGLGYTAGIGLDWMLTNCIFLRGEYEFVQFTSFGQTPTLLGGTTVSDHKATLNSVRGAVAYRF
jgi:opacity protein-like surface antigen